MKPEVFKLKSEQTNPLIVYSKEVLALMYPEKGRGDDIKAVMKKVLARHGITDFNAVGKWMSDIGAYIKTHGDLKRWEKEAVEVPLGKKSEIAPEPYIDPEERRKKSIEAANPMFPEFEEEMLKKRARDEYDMGRKRKSRKKVA